MELELEPPPGDVHEMAERAVEYVRNAVGITLGYDAETLPVLDHYLRTAPKDQPAAVDLLAAVAGAYFGEVARRTAGGEWHTDEADPLRWRLVLTGELELHPIAIAAQAILLDDGEHDGTFDVPAEDRDAVAEALTAQGEVPIDEYYSLCGRLEALVFVADMLAARRALRAARPPEV